MRPVLTIFAAALTAACAPPAYAGDHSALPPDLAAAVAAYDAAQVKGDGAALNRLLADDYVLVNSRAQVESKADLIRDDTTPGDTLKPYVVEDEVIRLWRDGAVLAGAVTLEGVSGGAPFKARIRFADVWARRDGRWQVAFTEVTKIPAG
ncbi:nuclear transport factor 2 family protein [Caulobacter sp. KR2-114]|uniref:nuclear transport factor 2 family protein n=1 Tax=Caulobacter sp. KR2-114 TaxID=3400912 RepID=UPI003BFBF324